MKKDRYTVILHSHGAIVAKVSLKSCNASAALVRACKIYKIKVTELTNISVERAEDIYTID